MRVAPVTIPSAFVPRASTNAAGGSRIASMLAVLLVATAVASGQEAATLAGLSLGGTPGRTMLQVESDDAPDEAGTDHAHGHGFTALPPALGSNLGSGWLAPWTHTHYSREGTPLVHAFGIEPAFLGREVFVDFTSTNGDGSEYELEVEFEYALTRRIGIVVEAGYAWLQPDDGPNASGFGDVALAPRFLLLEYDRFLLSTNLEFEFPTGDDERGLGEGEAVFAPSLATWSDLGSGFTLQASLGVEHGLSSDFDTLTWGGAIIYSINTSGEAIGRDAAGHVPVHFPAGLLNLIGEIGGEHPLDGEEEGRGTGELRFGASYSITPHLEARASVSIPAWRPREFDNSVTVGVIFHF
ncbi:MAG: transporter [Planctomycetota bacterium]